MINRDEATIAMINVSLGTATEVEKSIVEDMDERLFSDLYAELESGVHDSRFSIEDYYNVKGEEEKEIDKPVTWHIDDEDIEDEDIKEEFERFLEEFGSSYESKSEAYKDFIENYCSKTSDTNYSDEIDYELESLIVDEFADFLISNGFSYGDSDEAYDDYIRNYCSYN